MTDAVDLTDDPEADTDEVWVGYWLGFASIMTILTWGYAVTTLI